MTADAIKLIKNTGYSLIHFPKKGIFININISLIRSSIVQTCTDDKKIRIFRFKYGYSKIEYVRISGGICASAPFVGAINFVIYDNVAIFGWPIQRIEKYSRIDNIIFIRRPPDLRVEIRALCCEANNRDEVITFTVVHELLPFYGIFITRLNRNCDIAPITTIMIDQLSGC